MAFNLMTSKNTFTVAENIIGDNDNQYNCSVSRNTAETFFYSNNPETVDYGRLADSKVWLAHEKISGSGQIYTWHINTSQKTIHSDILLYNDTGSAVTITISNVGLTNGNGLSDRNAWISYYNNSTSRTYTLQSGAFLSPDVLQQSNIYNFNNFGKVARFRIEGPGSLYIYDLAYYTNSGAAQDPAAKQPDVISPTRGLGHGFYETMYATLTLTDGSATQSFSLGGADAKNLYKHDSFGNQDLVSITDSSASPHNASYNLFGNYGVQMRINLTINNQCVNGNNGKYVRIFMGTRAIGDGCALIPFCRYNSQVFSAFTGSVPYRNYIDVLYNNEMPFGSTTITFDMVVPAMSSAPVIVGARWVPTKV